mmetsp:Transcript_28071/g.38970  ORF Transcript_28071/g.38970 Transcript_28071/m.38970 type:complete len:149 (-) Transcript_28071:4324-4770(-)
MRLQNTTIKAKGSDVLKCGKRKIKLNTTLLNITNNVVKKNLIKFYVRKKCLRKEKSQGIASLRKKRRSLKRTHGRSRGIGKREGTKNARLGRKITWIRKLKNQRYFARKYLYRKKISHKKLKIVLNKIKGNYFSSTKSIIQYLKSYYK